MFRGRYRDRGLKGGSIAASGVALSAPTLTRTSAVSAYPPTVSFTRPIDWADSPTMYAVMQWSLDPAFGTGVTETASPQVITAAVTTYNFGLSAIVSGVYYMRLGAWSGTRPALNFSNIVGVGDAVAPTITSSAAPAGYQYAAGSQTLTANKLSSWAIVGGADQVQFTLSGSTLSWVALSSIASYVVQVQATSVFGIASTVQTITLGVVANTANAFSFTAVTNAVRSSVNTSNTITVAGIGSGSVPVSITGGTYSKNSGAYTASAGTAVNGDTFSLQETASASYSTATSATLTIGSTSGAYNVTTLANPVAVSANDVTTLTQQNPGGAGTTASWSFTTTGGRVVALINCKLAAAATVTSVTYGGTAMTQVSVSSGNQYHTAIYELAGVTAQTANIIITASSTFSMIAAAGQAQTLVNSPNAGTAATSLAYGYNTAGLSKTGTSTVPANGFGLAGVVSETSGATVAWVFGTKDGTDQSNAAILSSVAHYTATGVPQVNGLDSLGSGMAAVAWGP